MKINIIKSIAITFIVGVLVIPAFSFAEGVPAATGQNTSASTEGGATPTAVGQNTGAASPSPSPTPVATGQNTGAATASSGTPVATGQNTGAATPTPSTSPAPVATGQNTGAGTASGSTVVTNPAPTGQTTSSGSGGGSSVSSGSGYVYGLSAMPALPSLPSLTNGGQCKFITTYMKIGGNNPSTEVTKLQSFLRTEGIDVAVTGIFDEQTLRAVKAFQEKYLADVMLPWGVSTPTGEVYLTTENKINEIYCKTNFSLTAEQTAEIEAYKTSIINGTSSISNETGSTTDANGNTINSTSTVGDAQVGAVARTSLISIIWNFLKRIFGR